MAINKVIENIERQLADDKIAIQIKGHDELFRKGEELLGRVARSYVEDKPYEALLKADVALYLRDSLEQVLHVKELANKDSQENERYTKLAEDQDLFSACLSYVDGWARLAKSIGALKDGWTGKNGIFEAQSKLTSVNDDERKKALKHIKESAEVYNQLVYWKKDIFNAYEKWHQQASREKNNG